MESLSMILKDIDNSYDRYDSIDESSLYFSNAIVKYGDIENDVMVGGLSI